MELVHFFCVSKNEYDLIEDFICYYGERFGYGNITIIDNGSDHPTVLEVYKTYQLRGVEIVTELGYDGNRQGEHFTKHMTRYKTRAQLLIGLDTDEFLQVSADQLSDLLRSSVAEIFVIYGSFNSVPPADGSDFVRPYRDCTEFTWAQSVYPKVFFRGLTFLRTENGNHNGQSVSNIREQVYIKLFHYADTGRGRAAVRARDCCIGYGYISGKESRAEQISKLRDCRPFYGSHKRDIYLQWLQDEKEKEKK